MANELGDTNLTGALAVVGTATLGGLPLAISAVYTPTVTDVANAGTISTTGFRYSRIGDIVTVAGGLQAAITTISVLTQISITLPVASNFGNFYECSGSGTAEINSGGANIVPVTVRADTTNDVILLSFIPSTASSNIISFIANYRVI